MRTLLTLLAGASLRSGSLKVSLNRRGTAEAAFAGNEPAMSTTLDVIPVFKAERDTAGIARDGAREERSGNFLPAG